MRRVGWFVIGALLVMSGSASRASAEIDLPASDDATLPVVGGTHAVGRLLGFDGRSADFTGSLNRAFLRQIRADESWSDHPVRGRLDSYLQILDEIATAMPGGLEFSGNGALTGEFSRLAALLGYSLAMEPGGAVLLPLSGEDAILRRDVGRALGWDLSTTALRLSRGESVRFEIAIDHVRPPLAWEPWSRFVGRPVTPSRALLDWTRDQRISLIAAALERVSQETATLMQSGELGRWVHAHGAAMFYRHAPAIELRRGRLVLPGGPESAGVWRRVLGVSPDRPALFVRTLLERDEGRLAYFWHALHDAPPAVARIVLDLDENEEQSLAGIERWLQALTTLNVDFGQARPERPGLSAMFQALPLKNERLAPPGGLRLWDAALALTSIPTRPKRLERATRVSARPLSGREWMIATLTETVDVDGRPVPRWQRLRRVAPLFDENPDAFDPRALMVAAPAADLYPGAIDALCALRPAQPDEVVQFLWTVDHLDRLESREARHFLVTDFQAGVELLKGLSLGGTLPPDEIRTALREWVAIHRQAEEPLAAAGPQLDWLGRLVALLPVVEVGGARGPRDAALLNAVGRRSDPQQLRLDGLDYVGERAGQHVAAMSRLLQRQGIPSVDSVLTLREGLVEIRQAHQGPRVDWVHETARRMKAAMAELPPAALSDSRLSDRLRPLFESVYREDAAASIEPLLVLDSFNRFPKVVLALEAIDRMLVAEVRSVLLGPVYVRAMSEMDTKLYDHVALIRKHTITRDLEERATSVAANTWSSVGFVAGSLSEVGTHIGGDLGRIARPLADQRYSGRQIGGSASLAERFRVVLAASLSMRWNRLLPELTAQVVTRIDRGSRLLSRAVEAIRAGDDDPVVDRCAEVIPFARLERFALGGEVPVSISERLALGLRDGDSATSLEIPGLPIPAQGWPSYESLERDGRIETLLRREAVDLRLTVIEWIGRRALPGEVGADLMSLLLDDLAGTLRLSSRWDWSGTLTRLASYDEDDLNPWMRRCLERGYYRPAGF